MSRLEGGNINRNDEAITEIVEINSTTATKLLDVNSKRMYAAVWLIPDNSNLSVYVRKYPAADDNIKKGAVLTRDTLSNSNLFTPLWETKASNVYTGEISAISESGTFNVIVEEF